MGRGMSTTKLACFQVKSAYMSQMQESQTQLQQKVHQLEALVQRMTNQKQDEQGETSAPESVNKSVPARCLLVDWTGTEETVAEARLLSADPEEYVNDIPLGPHAVKVLVESALIMDAFLWWPTSNMTCIEEAVVQIIAWKEDSCLPVEEEVAQDMPKSPYLSSKNRCKLMDWATYDKHVAEGRWKSRDPQVVVNGIPLGPNAVKVYVDVVLSPHAFPWRPTPDVTNMDHTVNSFIAWPANQVENETHREASTHKSPVPLKSLSKSVAGPSLHKSPVTPRSSKSIPMAPLQPSPSSPKAPIQSSPPSPKAPSKKTKPYAQSPKRKSKRLVSKENQKCMLMDISGKKRVVAEGRWASNDPQQTVHHVPLGPNAVRVWVDVVKIKSAAVWRTNSEIETMEDALGSAVAWPKDKVVLC